MVVDVLVVWLVIVVNCDVQLFQLAVWFGSVVTFFYGCLCVVGVDGLLYDCFDLVCFVFLFAEFWLFCLIWFGWLTVLCLVVL